MMTVAVHLTGWRVGSCVTYVRYGIITFDGPALLVRTSRYKAPELHTAWYPTRKTAVISEELGMRRVKNEHHIRGTVLR